MPRRRFISAGSITDGNNAYQSDDLVDILRFGYGVDYPIGTSDQAHTNATCRTTVFSNTYLAQIIPSVITNRQKMIINLSEGPPQSTGANGWKTLNSNTAWVSKNRPPVAIHTAMKAMRQSIIDYIDGLYTAAGLTMSNYVAYKDWVEGGKGGANDCRDVGADTYSAPYDGYAEGTWDDDLHTCISTCVAGVNYRGCDVIWPTLECQGVTATANGSVFDQELATYGSAVAVAGWQTTLTGVCAGGKTVIGINLYPDIHTLPLQSIGHAVKAFSGMLSRVIDQIQAQSWYPTGTVEFLVSEHSWSTATGPNNLRELGAWCRACEEAAFQRGDIWGFSHFRIRHDTHGFKTLLNADTLRINAFDVDL